MAEDRQTGLLLVVYLKRYPYVVQDARVVLVVVVRETVEAVFVVAVLVVVDSYDSSYWLVSRLRNCTMSSFQEARQKRMDLLTTIETQPLAACLNNRISMRQLPIFGAPRENWPVLCYQG